MILCLQVRCASEREMDERSDYQAVPYIDGVTHHGATRAKLLNTAYFVLDW